jgi:hypothetical protein
MTIADLARALAQVSASVAERLEACDGAADFGLQVLDDAAQTVRCVAQVLERLADQPAAQGRVDVEALSGGLPLDTVRRRILGLEADEVAAPAGELELF